MIGSISLENLRVHCIVGILDRERIEEQDVFLDICLDWDFDQARKTENVKYTLDYAELAVVLEKFIQEKKFQLIETMAEECCDLIFNQWNGVSKCHIKIKKPAAVPKADHAAVSITRERTL